MKTEESKKISITDIGFSVCLMPHERRLVRLQPELTLRVERLYIERCPGVFLGKVKIGNQEQNLGVDSGVSTLFYSVPSSPETLDAIKILLREWDGIVTDEGMLIETAERAAEETKILGLPVSWDTCPIGNTITLKFENVGADPVRVTGVLRARVVVN